MFCLKDQLTLASRRKDHRLYSVSQKAQISSTASTVVFRLDLLDLIHSFHSMNFGTNVIVYRTKQRLQDFKDNFCDDVAKMVFCFCFFNAWVSTFQQVNRKLKNLMSFFVIHEKSNGTLVTYLEFKIFLEVYKHKIRKHWVN